MRQKKYLFGIIVLVIAICAYLLSSNTQTQALLVNPASQHEVLSQDSIASALITDNKKSTLESDDAQLVTCDAFEQAQQINDTSQSRFIRAKAMQWYFDGHDKMKIAETLAATFGYSTAISWINSIESISRFSDTYSQLTQTIASLSYSSDFNKKQMYLYPLSRFQLSNHTEVFDINQRLNEYPDLAIHHWQGALKYALKHKEYDKAMEAINALKPFIKKPSLFKHPLSDTGNYISLASFTQQEAKRIVIALFELSPFFFEENYKHVRFFKQLLLGLNIDESLWNFEYINDDDFNVDPTISALIEQVKIANPSFTDAPEASEFCHQETTLAEINKIQVTKVSSKQSKQILSPAWQGVKTLNCPDRTFTSALLRIKRELNSTGISMTDIQDYTGIQKHRDNIKMVLTQFDEFERSVFFTKRYRRNKLSVVQINTLIDDRLAPTNSDFYYLIANLPFAQQKQLLIEHQYTLSPFNGTDSSMIFNALAFGENNDDIVPFLLSQGFALKKDATSPDPLWLQLLSVQGGYNNDNEYVLPIKTIGSLIDHSQLTEVHVDFMYKIKQEHPALYEQLITEFPELSFPPPKELIEITCD